MRIGLVGLGKMGFNMRERLRRADEHTVVGYDRNPDVSDSSSLADMVAQLDAPRAVWVMVPAGDTTRETIRELAELLAEGDLVIDGGNSQFTDDKVNAAFLAEHDIGYLDIGVSGGVWGLENGYALMVGGSRENVERMLPIFDALRPEGPREKGFAHAGGVGAGHAAKMVHNAIEYGIMQAWGEGVALLEAMDEIENVPVILEGWSNGTVIRSWLLDLLIRAEKADPGLVDIAGVAHNSGEARWALEAGLDHGVSMPAIAAALFARFTSTEGESVAMKVVAAQRNQFGGHAVVEKP